MAMDKYADITPFYEWLELLEKECSSYPQYQTMMFYEIRDKLDDLPEVVRCKDCKYYGSVQDPCHGRTQRFCSLHKGLVLVTLESFCSYGERK